MHVIQDIGSIAGLLAIPALAVLSALYFSQARDVRRLREWAGRAPERAAAAAPRVDEAPRAAPPPPPPPGADPPTARADPPSPPAAPPPPPGPAPLPGREPPPPAPARPAAAATATRPPAATAAGGAPSRYGIRDPEPAGRPSGRAIAAIVAGIVVAGGAVGFVATQSSGGGSSSGGGGGGATASTAAARQPTPSQITVAVENGTSVPGLGARVGQRVKAGGFQLGPVGNDAGAGQGGSVVMFTSGQASSARVVANSLGVARTAPADPRAQAQAGSAPVIVIAGSDQAH